MTESATLLIFCPDRRGLVAAVTNFLYQNNGNVLHLDQHVDAEENVFFMRVEWDLDGFGVPANEIAARFQPIAARFNMTFDVRFSRHVPRMAVFVSKMGHCLYDILSRVQSGEWQVELPVIVSNHPDMRSVSEKFGIPYHEFTVTKETKPQVEQEQLALLKSLNIDFIVLARYMQIVSADFVSGYPNRIINIHHSFLPAFIGAKPYHAAHQRGVKIVGATSHYVTADLDAGPIIEQDIIRVNHRDSPDDLVRKGRDVEKLVLARAIWAHINHRILVYNNKTIVFA
ncbi:MAG: formyltetrahydrofolate deformylase [Phototrophicales bacterium]|nr:MAG: formyltetrahydrofolate deformylase [Phototrophicales bacterium]